jgi:adenine specific DNA methylase Mod
VKTDRLFRNLEVELDGTKFFFDVSTLEHKKANEKRNLVYSFKEKRKDMLVFDVTYSERGRKTNVDEILRTLRKQEVNIIEDKLERAFRVFEKQSEVDYFINKDAKAFLEEQFSLWLYQYVFSGESEWTEIRVKQLQTLKTIAFKIIAFISQFENELVKIWNKPKFVLNSNYVITLDRIAEKDMALVEKLSAHKNFKAQVEEWQQLGMVNDSFKKTALLEKDLTGKLLAKPYQYLPIDTKHFKDVELEILELFDNLDQELDGWLIKSENYQALNTIQSKFREKVRCIYIDPPYNTGSDEFIYRDRFQHSSWLSMMADRTTLARTILQPQGLFFSSIDFVEVSKFRLLLDEVFGATNFLADIAWEKRYTRSNNAKLFYSLKDTILTYRTSDFLTLLREARKELA